MPAPTIDLNADLGEEVTDDAGLIEVVTSANLACGFHAGGPAIMREVCDLAAVAGVTIGAQVSYADRENFGRRHMDVASATLTQWVADQVGALTEIARSAGIDVGYLKPHGALYNRVADDADQAAAVLAGSGDLPVLGLPGGVLSKAARLAGRRVIEEGFPDRGYTAQGRLIPRGEPGALIEDTDQIAARAVALAADVESVCVHGDSAEAVVRASACRSALVDAGYELRAFSRGGE